jgi:ferrochelatase
VLLINLGTPEEPTVPAVRRYLAEFLSDPEVIRLPTGLGWLNKPLARTIAQFRAPSSTELYRSIWTEVGSPLKTITAEQVGALREALPRGWEVYYAMRYGDPSIDETVSRIASEGIEELVVVPMYPQFSGPTTRTALTVLYKHLEHHDQTMQVTTRPVWHNDAGYINAQAALLEQFAAAHELNPKNTYLLFTAHGLPVSYVKRGDPYPKLVAKTVELVGQRMGWPADRLGMAYQSRFGPTQWLQPYADEFLEELAARGETNVMVCPVTFTADCLETIEELGVRYCQTFEQAGGRFHLCPALNTFEPFIEALRDLVLRGPKPVNSWGGEVRAVARDLTRRTPADADVASLVMIGASSAGRTGRGLGPNIKSTDAAHLRSVKRSQCEVPNFLRTLCEQVNVCEAWLWNTCKRFELYGVIEDPNDTEQRDRIVMQMTHYLFGDEPPAGVAVNVLFGREAYHHLLRTAAGFNSGLPGERDVLDQLRAAHRLATAAGTAGPFSKRLLQDVLDFERGVNETTDWGRFSPDYTYTAVSRTVRAGDVDWRACRAVVIGGSTTSASVLRTLIERFDMPARQLTLVYRGHKKGGQIKMLRKAIGSGRRIRVQSYSEPVVTRAIAEADLVVFGIDREEPVLKVGHVRGLRDFAQRPLRVIDFNVFGSTAGLESLDGVEVVSAQRLDAEVVSFAEEMTNDAGFCTALEAAEVKAAQRVDVAAGVVSGGSRDRLRRLGSLESKSEVSSAGEVLVG